MSGNDANSNGKEHLTLRSQISELAQISPWIEHLASQYAIPTKTQFAMNLCLEEALSNIVRHGYGGAPDHNIFIDCRIPQSGVFLFVVDDEAPHFNPVEALEPPIPGRLEDLQVGGQGIRLLRRFADNLKYEATPSGNRLSISFFTSSAKED
jgi:anti-sigma regulatory factor (Ser/Thr protein kinase)